jgi:hypothetical protein
MELYLNTRGFRSDYTWLPHFPEDCWWEQYRRWTDFEFPTVLLQHEANGDLKFFLSALPSARRDFSGTPIRVSIAGRYNVETDNELSLYMVSFISEVLDWAVRGIVTPGISVQEKIDKAFPSSWVEQALKSDSCDEPVQQFKKELLPTCPAVQKADEDFEELSGEARCGDLAGALLDLASARSVLQTVGLHLQPRGLTLIYLNAVASEEQGKNIVQELAEGRSAFVCLILGSIHKPVYIQRRSQPSSPGPVKGVPVSPDQSFLGRTCKFIGDFVPGARQLLDFLVAKTGVLGRRTKG